MWLQCAGLVFKDFSVWAMVMSTEHVSSIITISGMVRLLDGTVYLKIICVVLLHRGDGN